MYQKNFTLIGILFANNTLDINEIHLFFSEQPLKTGWSPWCSTWKIFAYLYFSRIWADTVKIIFEFESRGDREGCGWTYHTFLRSEFNLSILWFFVTKIAAYKVIPLPMSLKGRIFISVSFTRRGVSWVLSTYEVSLRNQWLKKLECLFFALWTKYFYKLFSCSIQVNTFWNEIKCCSHTVGQNGKPPQ